MRLKDFYPRPPQGGRRTLPRSLVLRLYFYPRPPQGGRHRRNVIALSFMYFYPRPPQGGRHQIAHLDIPAFRFLSTPSARRATTRWMYVTRGDKISIHALRKEGDDVAVNRCGDCLLFLSTPSARRATSRSRLSASPKSNFYPRPPQGGRLLFSVNQFVNQTFLSTPSARRATRHPQAQV